MPGIHPRAVWAAGILSVVTVAGLLAGGSANAVVGTPVNDSYSFTAQLDIDAGNGSKRGCSAALVEQQWLVTAASCLAGNPAQGTQIPAGAPALPTTATIGRVDATRQTGTVVDVVELVPRTDRDLVMARLAKPVTGISPVGLGFNPLVPGEDVRVTGYGRTKDEWVPQRLHTTTFTTGDVKDGTVALSGKSDNAAICQGDTGGPAFRDINGRYELIGVHSRSWQGGCLGTDPSEARTGATDARTDDIAGWIQGITSRDVLRRKNWNDARSMVPGYFTGGSPGGRRHMDLFVAWKDGSASLFQGADNSDPKYPFTAEYKLAGSGWQYAMSVAGGNFTGSGTDGLVVRWQNGQVTWFSHVDQNGFSKEEQLSEPTKAWKEYAKQITVGRYTANAQRDDLLVTWVDGSISLFPDLGTNGLKHESQLLKANQAGTNIEQISAGEFTGKGTADLLVRWRNGSGSIYPGVNVSTKFDDEIKILQSGSDWRFAQSIVTGSFSANARPNDVLVRWENGNLSMYPAMDATGPHIEVQLLK